MNTATPTPGDVTAAVEMPGFDWVTTVIFVGIVFLLVMLRFWTSDPRTMSLTKAVVSLVALAALVVSGMAFGRTGLLIVVATGAIAIVVYWRTRADPPDTDIEPDT